MPYLGDYVGHLLSELTKSRAQADGETIRLAELYAEHEYLKHFPVPRFRIMETQLEIPVVVINTEDQTEDNGPRGGPSAADTSLIFDEIVAKHIEHLQLSDEQQNQVRGGLSRQYQLLKQRMPEGLDAGGLAVRLTKSLKLELQRLKLKVTAEKQKEILMTVQKEAKEELLLNAISPKRILVGVKSSEVKNAHPDAVMRISIKLVEEAMEWTVLDQDGENSILAPE